MGPVSEWIRVSVLAAVAARTLTACGEGAAGESAGRNPIARARAASQGHRMSLRGGL